MPRSSDPFKSINWQTAPALHDLSVSVGEHFSDARAGQPLAANELLEDCMAAFKQLGIVPGTIITAMNVVYGLNNSAPRQPEAVAPNPVPKQPEVVVTPAPKQPEKGGFFNR